jgi:hypothetical protein
VGTSSLTENKASGTQRESEHTGLYISDNETHESHSWTYVRTKNMIDDHKITQLACKEVPGKRSREIDRGFLLPVIHRSSS